MLENSESCTDENLRQLALQDYQMGGPGRANAVLTLPLNEVRDLYFETPFVQRNQPILFYHHQLDETVAAILDDVSVPKYRRL
jgi:hypothetical protein